MSDVIQTLVDNVSRIRVEQGRTQQQIAEAIGYSREYWNRCEARRAMPISMTVHQLVVLAMELNVSVAELFTEWSRP